MKQSKITYTGLQTLEVLEGADRYNKWIADAIKPYLSAPVLEIGAGIGNITEYFLDIKPFFATDIEKGLLKKIHKRFRSRSIIVDELDITKLPPAKYRNYFSSIVCINVLEHIKNDEEALRNVMKLLKKGGIVVFLVPAHMQAFNRTDEVLGHFRRYEKEELATKLQNAGFVIDDIYHFNIVGLLSWVIRDKFERKNFHLKPYQIALFDIFVPILKHIEKCIRVPKGISLIAVARKE